MKKLNNRGFTLVELIVVIAILGILAGVMSYSVNQIFSGQARQFADEYDALLTQCRVSTLSGAAAPTYVMLCQDSGGDYYGVLVEGGAEVSRKQPLLHLHLWRRNHGLHFRQPVPVRRV